MPGHEREEVLLGAAVGAGREDLDDADAAAAGDGRPIDRRRGTDPRASARSCQPFLRRTRSRWIGSSSAPQSYLYGLVAAQEVEPAHAAGQRARDVGVDHQDAGRQVARVRVDAGVVVEVARRARLEMDARRDPPAADRQERQAQRPVGAVELEQPPERRPGSGRRRACRGTGRRRPSVFWCRSMKASRVGERVGRSRRGGPRRRPRRDGPCAGSRGAPSCRASPGSRPSSPPTGQRRRPGRRPRARR